MKTRAFKKAISVVCVLAMLLSLCVVSFVGTASAAEVTYTLNNNGVVYTQNLTKGADIPAPVAPVAGATFIGWYDDINFTNQVTVAGDDTTLFARYDSVMATFDYTESSAKGYYDPNGKFGVPGIGGYQIVADPDNADNKVLLADTGFSGTTMNMCLETFPGSGVGFKPAATTKYVINFKYKAIAGSNPGTNGYLMAIYLATDAGIGQSGNKNGPYYYQYLPYTDEWTEASLVITGFQASALTSWQNLLICSGEGSNDRGKIYYDDIAITVDTEKNYTLYNEGVKEVKTAKAGDALPTIANSNFLGWYDESLTTKYTTYPFGVTTLVAKYDGVVVDFDNPSMFKPNATAPIQLDLASDPTNASNKVLTYDKTKAPNGMSFAPLGAMYATDGLKLENGKVYKVEFNYYVANIGTSTVSFMTRASNAAGIGNTGGKTDQMSGMAVTSNTNGWAKGSMMFTYNGTDASPYFIFLAHLTEGSTADVYIDNVKVKPYVANVVVEDIEMDFEDVSGESFKWSEGANNFTQNSGDGYVNRGEIVTAADGDKAFRLMHFQKKKGNFYFTVNNGTTHFEFVNGGIYTVSFDYLVEHSETETKIGLYFVDPAMGAVKGNAPFSIIDECVWRDDDPDGEWSHAEITFIALHDLGAYTSLGIGLYNSTNCPIEFASSVLFDDVVVKTHSVTGTSSVIVFDSKGGTKCEPLAVEVGDKVGTLPAPTKYGYNFAGWKYDVTTGSGDSAVTTTYDLTADATKGAGITYAYAAWELQDGVVEISFKTNVKEYDANVQNVVAIPGEPIQGMPEDPTFTNQTFVGWYTDRNFKNKLDLSCAPSTSIVAYAKWKTEGVLIDYENYTFTGAGRISDRYKLIELDDGNTVLSHSLEYGTNKDAAAIARCMFQVSGGSYVRAYEGSPYTITFKYKIEDYKTQGKFYIFLSTTYNTWADYREQFGSFTYNGNTDGWVTGEMKFNAMTNLEATETIIDAMSIACSGDATIYIDDVLISCPENEMNVYGSAVRFNVNGGKAIQTIAGDPGDALKLPTPFKAGYKFIGWFADSAMTVPFTETTFGTEPIIVHAKWQLGKLVEDFEDFPASVQQLGIGGGYSFYNKNVVGFDSSNIRSGAVSLFRNGTTSGDKSFTCMRDKELSLEVGETYTISFYVKPTAITDDTGTILLKKMNTYTGLTGAIEQGVIKTMAELTEGEWQKVSYTFVAESKYVALCTTAGNDMYFDDIEITLKGYTGSAPTGDTSVSPLIILAVIILSAGALLFTGKKVFSK